MADEELGEDDVFVLESIAEAKKTEEDKLRVTIVLAMKDSMVALGKVVKIIEVNSFILTFCLLSSAFLIHFSLLHFPYHFVLKSPFTISSTVFYSSDKSI